MTTKWCYWLCACGCPMDKPVRSSDYWRCRFCGNEMDGWYPKTGFLQVYTGRPTGRKLMTDLPDGSKAVFIIHREDDGRVFVETTDDRPTKHPFKAGHHFDSPQVRSALSPDKAS